MEKEKIPVLVSKPETRWQNFLFSSRSLILGGRVLVLVSKQETKRKEFPFLSWSLILGGQILVLVSKHETERKKFSFSSRNTRLIDIYSQSCLKSWNKPLVGHCPCHHYLQPLLTLLCSTICTYMYYKTSSEWQRIAAHTATPPWMALSMPPRHQAWLVSKLLFYIWMFFIHIMYSLVQLRKLKRSWLKFRMNNFWQWFC